MDLKKCFLNEKTQKRLLDSRTIRLFFIVALAVSVITFFVQVILSKGAEGMQVFFQDPKDTFMDFFKVQKSIANLSPVTEGIYPPLAYIILLPFNFFVDNSHVTAYAARASQAGIMSYVIFLVSWLFIGAVFLSKILSEHRKQKNIIIFLLFLSAPMLFLMERGNVNVVVLAFVAVFFAYYEDENVMLREIALIALAIATGIKLYPVLFGALLFKKDTLSRFFRLAGYCLLFTILPFFCFEGGLNNLRTMVGNILHYSNGFSNWSHYIALRSVMGFEAMFRSISLAFEGDYVQGYMIAARVTTFVMLAGSIIGSFFVDRKWKRAMLLACPIVLFPAMSATYNAIFLIIPILLFLIEKERRFTDYIYLVLFIIVLSPAQYGNWIDMVAWSTVISNMSVVAINCLLCLEGLIGLIRAMREKRVIQIVWLT
jgi:hypothetical protein